MCNSIARHVQKRNPELRAHRSRTPDDCKPRISEERKNNPPQKRVDIIDSLIASHMGKWTQSKYSETVLPDPEEYEGQVAKMAKIVHLCDFLAAQKTFLNVQAFRHFMCDEDGLNIPESFFPEWIDQVCRF